MIDGSESYRPPMEVVTPTKAEKKGLIGSLVDSVKGIKQKNPAIGTDSGSSVFAQHILDGAAELRQKEQGRLEKLQQKAYEARQPVSLLSEDQHGRGVINNSPTGVDINTGSGSIPDNFGDRSKDNHTKGQRALAEQQER